MFAIGLALLLVAYAAWIMLNLTYRATGPAHIMCVGMMSAGFGMIAASTFIWLWRVMP